MGKFTKVKTLNSVMMEKHRKMPYRERHTHPSFLSSFHLFMCTPKTYNKHRVSHHSRIGLIKWSILCQSQEHENDCPHQTPSTGSSYKVGTATSELQPAATINLSISLTELGAILTCIPLTAGPMALGFCNEFHFGNSIGSALKGYITSIHL